MVTVYRLGKWLYQRHLMDAFSTGARPEKKIFSRYIFFMTKRTKFFQLSPFHSCVIFLERFFALNYLAAASLGPGNGNTFMPGCKELECNVLLYEYTVTALL